MNVSFVFNLTRNLFLVTILQVALQNSAYGFASDKNEVDVVSNLTGSMSYRPDEVPPNNPLSININIKLLEVFGMSPVTADFETILLLQNSWYDSRLNYTGLLNNSFIDITYLLGKVWAPRLYFSNAKTASRSNIASPNYRLILYQNGTLEESHRIMLTTHCNLKLHMFPFDAQQCPIDIESISASKGHFNITWQGATAKNDVSIPEFILSKLIKENCEAVLDNTNCLRLVLDMDREYQSYVFSTFVPLILVVCVGWAAFWMDATVIPGRSTLGVLGIMTSSIQIGNLRNQSPHVGYLRAIDIYGVICLIFAVMAFIESHVNNYLVRRDKVMAERKKKKEEELKKRKEENGDTEMVPNDKNKKGNKYQLQMPEDIKKPSKISKLLESHDTKMDLIARVLFPFAFIVFNIIYWIVCLVVLEQ